MRARNELNDSEDGTRIGLGVFDPVTGEFVW